MILNKKEKILWLLYENGLLEEQKSMGGTNRKLFLVWMSGWMSGWVAG